MTDLRERIVAAAYPLFIRRGIRDVTEDEICTAAGVNSQEFRQNFSSRNDVASVCLGQREESWTFGVVEAGARERGTTPEERLLAIFDVFDDWFQRDDYEACTFINVLLEMGNKDPLGHASIGYLLNIRRIIATLADEAQLRDADEFALSWHILMKGSIISAVEGDQRAAARAKEFARDLIARHRPNVGHASAAPSRHDDFDAFDAQDLLGVDVAKFETPASSGRGARALPSAGNRADFDFDFDF